MTERVYSDDMTNTTATLYSYSTGEAIRPATAAELAASIAAAEVDGGAGVIDVDGTSCYAVECCYYHATSGCHSDPCSNPAPMVSTP